MRKKKKKILVQNLDGLLPTGWARHRAHRRGRWGAGLGAGALGRWGAGLGAGRWAGRRALGERACVGAGAAGSWARGRKAQRTCAGVCGREWACADGRGRAHGVHAQAGKQADVLALGARGAGSERQGAAGRAVGRGRTRGRARQGAAVRGLGVQLGQVGCFGAPDSVFGPVRLGSFLSHQMNTVHCKIFFRKKKIFIKFN